MPRFDARPCSDPNVADQSFTEPSLKVDEKPEQTGTR